MADQSIIRITKSSDLSLAVAFRDRDVRNVRALIIGPHETPYEFGFFEFGVKFNKDYPRKSPSVTGTTTNGGRCRFNPNIYANGKIHSRVKLTVAKHLRLWCLTSDRTWRGERGEEWSAAQGLESILLSIQSLMSSNPYENEPGFEDAHEESDKKNQKDYVAKIRHETLRISVIQRMEDYLGITETGLPTPSSVEREQYNLDMDDVDELSIPWEPFKDLCKHRFLWYYDSYLESITKAKEEWKDGTPFNRMPFEGSTNSMEGKFNYTELERRMHNIKAALDAEPGKWATEGLSPRVRDSTVAVNLARQYEQIKEHFKRTEVPHNIELENGNPFVWNFSYFGQPMTNLDGGMFMVKINFSPRFPEEQPRIKFHTKMYHHRLTQDGTPCYFPNASKREDVRQHLEAIIEALEDEHPPYDPRTLVHPDAHKLYWGSPDERKQYNRKLRRSVQQSLEDF
ncbi:UBC-like protein [Xylariomycetidae sp. FL2044]|nr:UBC-like protein [Xylariomycetidae sp. FL2044]